MNIRQSWRESLSRNIDIRYREAFLQEDIKQAQIIIAIVAMWVLTYTYADYLELGAIKSFYQLMILRVIFFGTSLGIIFRIPKSKNVHLIDFTVLTWSMTLAMLAILANNKHKAMSVEDIMVHYILLLGFYLLIPNRLTYKMLPAFSTTFVDILVLIAHASSKSPTFPDTIIFTSITTLVAINILGILSSMRTDVQRSNQYLVQKTLIDGRAQLKELATTDSLTGILNRRSFFESAEIQFDRFKRYQEHFTFVILDLDNLKTLNDTYGHPAGDHSLCLLTDTIKVEKRSSDIIGRLAGDEFGIVLPNTDADKAGDVLARIKNSLADIIVESPTKEQFQVSFSAGAAEVLEQDKTFNEIYRRADKALLSAKKLGRNRIEKA